MEKEHDAFEVKLWTEEVKEDILAIALVEFCDKIRELVLHGECARCIAEARYHLPNGGLQ